MLLTAATAATEIALNRMLALDPIAQQKLIKMAGKTLRIVLQGTPVTLTIRCHSSGLALATADDAVVDAVITGPPLALLQMSTQRPGTELFGSGSVHIDGNVEVVQRIQAILYHLDIDWEELLSHWLSDPIAYQLGRGWRSGRNQLQRLLQRGSFQLEHYLHYEAEQLPLDWEIDEFNTAVDSLRADVERMQLRIARLQTKLNGKIL